MSHVRGIVVQLKTENQSGAGTDDHIYVGVVGRGGGREFPLATNGFNDFEKGTNIKYWFGTVWDGGAVTGAKKPADSTPGGRNDPAWHRIELDEIDYVYVRKQGSRSSKGDNAWKMDNVEVSLYGSSSPSKRTFGTSNDLWFGNEYGQNSWLPEILKG